LAIIFAFVVPAFAQKNSQTIQRPTWQSYHGVAIGATADLVREKLGKPKSEDADGLFFLVSDVETAQFLLDTDGKVKAISVIFDAEHLTPPTYQDVFGKSVVAEARPDGGIFKMVRYEDLGFWISFNRQSGEKAMVIVLIQKI
jgi:hypothetical protein